MDMVLQIAIGPETGGSGYHESPGHLIADPLRIAQTI